MKHVANILLLVAIVVLGYLCVMSILTPIHFDEQRAAREKVVINKLIDIRKVEVEFKNQNGHYTTSIDSLVDFIHNGKVPQVFKKGVLTDEQMANGLTEQKAIRIVKSGNQKEIIANGLQDFRRDTSFVSVFEHLFADRTIEEFDTLGNIPFSNGQLFEIEAVMHNNATTGVIVPLFQARAHYNTYLGDLDKQQLINLIDKTEQLFKFPGLQVGSVDEPNNNAGNWE